MYHATASTRVKGIDREKRKGNCQKTAVGYIFATINCYITLVVHSKIVNSSRDPSKNMYRMIL